MFTLTTITPMLYFISEILAIALTALKNGSKPFDGNQTKRTKIGQLGKTRLQSLPQPFVAHLLLSGPWRSVFLSFSPRYQRNTRLFFCKHRRYKHRQPQIWPKIKHHLSTSLSLTSLQHTNLVCANYLNFPNFTVFGNTKIQQSYSFHTLNHSSFKIFKFLWLGCTIDEHKSY